MLRHFEDISHNYLKANLRQVLKMESDFHDNTKFDGFDETFICSNRQQKQRGWLETCSYLWDSHPVLLFFQFICGNLMLPADVALRYSM